MTNGGPGRSWPRLAVSWSSRAWPQCRWSLSTTTQPHLPHRRPLSSGQTHHHRHRRVRQETPISNLGVCARTGTRRKTRPKIGHAITHHRAVAAQEPPDRRIEARRRSWPRCGRRRAGRFGESQRVPWHSVVVGEQPFHTYRSRAQADLRKPAVDLLLALRGIAQVEWRIRDQVGSRLLAVSSGFGDQVAVGPAWRVDEEVRVSLGA